MPTEVLPVVYGVSSWSVNYITGHPMYPKPWNVIVWLEGNLTVIKGFDSEAEAMAVTEITKDTSFFPTFTGTKVTRGSTEIPAEATSVKIYSVIHDMGGGGGGSSCGDGTPEPPSGQLGNNGVDGWTRTPGEFNNATIRVQAIHCTGGPGTTVGSDTLAAKEYWFDFKGNGTAGDINFYGYYIPKLHEVVDNGWIPDKTWVWVWTGNAAPTEGRSTGDSQILLHMSEIDNRWVQVYIDKTQNIFKVCGAELSSGETLTTGTNSALGFHHVTLSPMDGSGGGGGGGGGGSTCAGWDESQGVTDWVAGPIQDLEYYYLAGGPAENAGGGFFGQVGLQQDGNGFYHDEGDPGQALTVFKNSTLANIIGAVKHMWAKTPITHDPYYVLTEGLNGFIVEGFELSKLADAKAAAQAYFDSGWRVVTIGFCGPAGSDIISATDIGGTNSSGDGGGGGGGGGGGVVVLEVDHHIVILIMVNHQVGLKLVVYHYQFKPCLVLL